MDIVQFVVEALGDASLQDLSVDDLERLYPDEVAAAREFADLMGLRS